MPAATEASSVGVRRCPYCGKSIKQNLDRCPICREAIPEIRLSRAARQGGGEIRRGLLGMLLALIIYYFASGSSGMDIPFIIQPFVSTYLAPLLFLASLSLSIYGLFRALQS
ncbi:MAG TPA: hypothetical protein VOA41_12225 [Candidatus Dormibacteraeota bacterium]|nr:hypothetical protein [Candidatus Dormibacteraeota bacterium]